MITGNLILHYQYTRKETNSMPEATFTISGSIEDFTRADNLYKSLKREAEKFLSTWTMNVEIKYSEKKGEKPS